MLEIARDPRVLKNPAPVVFVTGLGESAIDISLRVWVETANYWPVTFDFIERAKEKMDEAGISIPFPHRVVKLVQSA
ncbi:Small-conductance mechanosensitive channel [compost metagenome]